MAEENTSGEQRRLALEFMDGTSESYSCPRQMPDGYGTRIRFDTLMEKPYLMIECDCAVTFYPTVNIKLIRTSPAPEGLPEYVIRGAQLES
jgi:hypothetical protein